MVYNFDAIEDDDDIDADDSLEVQALVSTVVVVDPSSLTVNFNANASHIRNNISSMTPTMGNVVVMHIPTGTHNFFLLLVAFPLLVIPLSFPTPTSIV
jgi:hypothetical protein